MPDSWAVSFSNKHPVETVKLFDFYYSPLASASQLRCRGSTIHHEGRQASVLEAILTNGKADGNSQLWDIGAQIPLGFHMDYAYEAQWTFPAASPVVTCTYQEGYNLPQFPASNMTADERAIYDRYWPTSETYMSEMAQTGCSAPRTSTRPGAIIRRTSSVTCPKSWQSCRKPTTANTASDRHSAGAAMPCQRSRQHPNPTGQHHEHSLPWSEPAGGRLTIQPTPRPDAAPIENPPRFAWIPDIDAGYDMHCVCAASTVTAPQTIATGLRLNFHTPTASSHPDAMPGATHCGRTNSPASEWSAELEFTLAEGLVEAPGQRAQRYASCEQQHPRLWLAPDEVRALGDEIRADPQHWLEQLFATAVAPWVDREPIPKRSATRQHAYAATVAPDVHRLPGTALRGAPPRGGRHGAAGCRTDRPGAPLVCCMSRVSTRSAPPSRAYNDEGAFPCHRALCLGLRLAARRAQRRGARRGPRGLVTRLEGRRACDRPCPHPRLPL